eukprot:GHVT01101490.1.p1 GENE.GHVT01101490.1~~GHVT01101490.1.p1  ORF type:complete len:148 (-),score=26.56 GHVT01101490.1:339-782(-)
MPDGSYSPVVCFVDSQHNKLMWLDEEEVLEFEKIVPRLTSYMDLYAAKAEKVSNSASFSPGALDAPVHRSLSSYTSVAADPLRSAEQLPSASDKLTPHVIHRGRTSSRRAVSSLYQAVDGMEITRKQPRVSERINDRPARQSGGHHE